jgi:hypothetical protein
MSRVEKRRGYLAILIWMSAILQGCDPIYSINVRADLVSPLEPQCIEDTLRKLEGIEQVTVHKSEPRKVWSLFKGIRDEQYPDQILFQSPEVGGVLVQHQVDDGHTILYVNSNKLGPKPPEDYIQKALELDARVGIQVAHACKATYIAGGEFKCFPDSVRCRETLLHQSYK